MKKTEKREYRKPHLRVIALETADVMGSGCKNDTEIWATNVDATQ